MSGSVNQRSRAAAIRRWTLWSLPARVKVTLLAIDAAAVACFGLAAVSAVVRGAPPPGCWWVYALALGVVGVVSTEASLGVERLRRTDESPHIDLSSVWAFAGAALLPGAVAVGVAVVIYLHMYLRVWRRCGVPTHRVVFSTATIVLAVQAAAGVVGTVGRADVLTGPWGVVAVIGAMLAYAAVNITLVVGVMVLSAPVRDLATLRQVVGSMDNVVLEFATLSMGALVAAAMSAFGPAYVVLGLPPLIVLHRTVLVRQLEEAASTDSKTGLLNAEAWRVQAAAELLRAERADLPTTVLLLDLDHFKLVNDRHGHLVGDHVLAAVALAVRAEVRDDDIVGRFGGEEFVVLLRAVESTAEATGSDEDARIAARMVAERIRLRVAGLRIAVPGSGSMVDGLTVSIGGAVRPLDGLHLQSLLEAADSAMYEAKHSGRDCVRMGQPTHRTEEVPRTG